MARIIIASPAGGGELEVDQGVFDAGFFPGYFYVRDAGPSPSTEPDVLDVHVANLIDDQASDTVARLRAAFGPGARLASFDGVPVADNAGTASTSGNQSNGTNTQGQYRVSHRLVVDATSVRLVFANFGVNGSLGETLPTAPITVRAGLELASGPIQPVYFRGARDATIQPGDFAVSDPVFVGQKAASLIASRTRVTVTSGQVWPYTSVVNNTVRAGDGTEESNTISDKTTSGTISAGANYAYGPVAILAAPVAAASKIAVLLGDSIISGANDTDPGLGIPYNYGYAERAMAAAGIPFQRISTGGDRLTGWNNGAINLRRRRLMYGATHALCSYGINDLMGAGRNAAQVQTDLITAWNELVGIGAKVYAPTYTPYTTSTDSWATTANQTPNGNEAARLAMNAWLRDGAPLNTSTKTAVAVGTTGATIARAPYYGTTGQLVTAGSGTGHPLTALYELADICETARNSGRWKVDGSAQTYTTDGIHPRTNLHTLMAAAVPVAAF